MAACSNIERGENLLYMTDDMIVRFFKMLDSNRYKTVFIDGVRWHLIQELLEGSFPYKDASLALNHITGHPRSLFSILVRMDVKELYFIHKTFGAFDGFN